MAMFESSSKCHICKEVPARKIFLWENGHNSCYDCAEKSPTKFQGKIRNRALELDLNNCDFDCVYKADGCHQTFKRGELKQHIQECDYSPAQNPPLCKIIGYPTCQFIPSRATRAEILEHFKANHDDDVWLRNKTSWMGLRLTEAIADYRRLILRSFDNSDTGPLVLILLSYSAATKVTSWLCVLLWADKTKGIPTLFADFALQSVDEAAPDIKWTLPVINITLAKISLEAKAFYQHPLLMEQYGRSLPSSNSRSVAVRIELMRRENSSGLATPLTNGAASSSNSSSSTPTVTAPSFEDSNGVTDMNLKCKHCKQLIEGRLYSCLTCPEYYLCAVCVHAEDHHPHSNFFAMTRSMEQQARQNANQIEMANKLEVNSTVTTRAGAKRKLQSSH